MKKFLLVIVVSLVLPAQFVHADNELCPSGSCASSLETCDGGACVSIDGSCNDSCGEGTACSAGTCVTIGANGGANNTAQANCGTTQAACPSGSTCQAGVCINGTGQVTSGVTPGSATTGGTGFQALAPIPGLTDNQTTPNISAFLNSLYTFAIGIAAALAIIWIIWGGAEIMTQDSVSKQGAGRAKIQNALLGLVLVLAPYLVFYVINPSILTLNINMQALTGGNGGGASTAGGGAVNQNIACTGGSCTIATQQCATMTEGSPNINQMICLNSSGAQDPNTPEAPGGVCPLGDTVAVQCQGTAPVNGAGQAGTTPNANTVVLFDGTYMDLVKYIGSNASQAAQAYTCQAAGQGTPLVFPGPVNSANSAYEYAMCLTPQFNYVSVSNTTTFGAGADPASQPAQNKYSGECQSIKNVLSSEGFSVTVVERDNLNPVQTTCSPADSQIGTNPICYNTSSSCTVQTD